MKKVLIVGHFWPYAPGGSKRILGLAKYLPEFGWEPICLTTPLQKKPNFKFRIIEAPTSNIIISLKRKFHLNPTIGLQEQIGIPVKIRDRKSLTTKIIKLFEGVIAYPDVERGWIPVAVKAAKNFLKKEKVDAMISVWPIPAHLIAKKLKKEYKIPWIADFPDLWSETYAYSYDSIRKFFDRRLEKKTIKLADFVTTSCWPQAEVLERLHKEKEVQTVVFGYDPDKINEPPQSLTKEFTVTYTALWHGRERDPLKFFIALNNLISEGLIDPTKTKVRFYGPQRDWIETEIKEQNLSKVVEQKGVVSWDECTKKQTESQLLLLLNWENKNEKGAFSGKFFDYLAARRPMIAAGGSGQDLVIKEMLSETNAGLYCPEVEDIKKTLLQFYSEYQEKGAVSFKGNIEKINKYNYKEMAKKFAEILNLIITNPKR